MESKLYKITDQQVKNLLVFLDRVEYKGFVEVQAATELLKVLTEPIINKEVV